MNGTPIEFSDLPYDYQTRFRTCVPTWRGTIVDHRSTTKYQFLSDLAHRIDGFNLFVTSQIAYLPALGLPGSGGNRLSLIPISITHESNRNTAFLTWMRPYYGHQSVRY